MRVRARSRATAHRGSPLIATADSDVAIGRALRRESLAGFIAPNDTVAPLLPTPPPAPPGFLPDSRYNFSGARHEPSRAFAPTRRRGTPRRQGRNRPRAIYRRHSLFACERVIASRRWCRSVGGNTHGKRMELQYVWISLRKEFCKRSRGV